MPRLHPNGVRVHLDRLREAGLVARSRMTQPRGRPRHGWSVHPHARPVGDAPQAYGDLARWLARAIRPRRAGLHDIEATGREIGRELTPRTGSGASGETMQAALAALGFQPRVERGRGGAVTYCLGNCPYRDAVRESQEVVCTLHRGITRGLLDVVEPKATLAGFVPRDPYDGGCLIELDDVGTTVRS